VRDKRHGAGGGADDQSHRQTQQEAADDLHLATVIGTSIAKS
jgi:hypothetical protein